MEDIKLKIVQYPSEAFNAQTLLANSTLYDDLIYIKTFQVGWGFLGTLCVVLNILLIAKNLFLILAYFLNRRKEGNSFRPKSQIHGFEAETILAFHRVLTGEQPPALEEPDQNGNSELHRLVSLGEQAAVLQERA